VPVAFTDRGLLCCSALPTCQLLVGGEFVACYLSLAAWDLWAANVSRVPFGFFGP